MAHHAAPSTPRSPKASKQDILAGYVHDVVPYDAERRFASRRVTNS
jgi:hypothetical protein